MKTVLVSCLCLICLHFADAGQITPLGSLLSKYYGIMKDDEQAIVLISFADKGGPSVLDARTAASLLSERAIQRRIRFRGADQIIDMQDLPLEESYVQAVAREVIAVRHELKWFNAVSAVATKRQIESIRRISFVKEIDLVGRWKTRPQQEQPVPLKYTSSISTPNGATLLDYGTSLTQVNQINVPTVHNLGIFGQGVVVGVFDNGFRLLTHEAFSSMNIMAQHDFVDHKESVVPNNPSTAFGSHGVMTLSTIGGYKPGQLIGPAFKASYILARTENDSSETPIEEDNWAAAIQWADSIGVDVTSTSLGYLTFDSPYTSLTWEDMNGHTALITNAADRAVSLGIVVVNSAGNDGYDSTHNTLIAPADGDSVITAGAVDGSGNRTNFSSVGPTTDVPPRIKPDVMAMGSGVKVASATDPTGYGSASGTSFSCPLSAGVAALIRCANPRLTPMQVRDAMRNTANNAASPNNLVGWGILNADSAIKYFGALPMGRIRGIVFNDLNGNGIRDTGEPAIPGALVRLTGAAVESTLTDASGSYTFDSLPIGTYSIAQSAPLAWVETSPPTPYVLTLLHKADTAGLDFGDIQPGTISGIVFRDGHDYGVRDSDEAGIAGWTVMLAGPDSLRTNTDSSGNFRFTNLLPGTYSLSESLQVNLVQTIPAGNGSYIITMRSGLDTTNLLFGLAPASDSFFFVQAGWNLLSLPKTFTDSWKNILYPMATSSAIIYTGRYVPIDTIPNRIGFWLRFPTTGWINIGEGARRFADTISVRHGWNLIGSISLPVPTSSILCNPSDMVASRAFGYNGQYFTSDTIQPGCGYWIKVNQEGNLILSSSGTALAKSSSAHIRIVPTSEMPPPPPDESAVVAGHAAIEYALEQAYPNPFNPTTVIRYSLPVESRVRLTIYSTLGQRVSILADGIQDAGYEIQEWNAAGVASGVYFCRLEATSVADPSKTFSAVKKMLVVR